MNERIKELVGIALDKAVPYTWHNLDHIEVEKVMKEFAMLMHDECIDAVPNDLDPATYFKVLQAIKNHFGF